MKKLFILENISYFCTVKQYLPTIMKKIAFVIYSLLIMTSLHVHATDIETATDAVRNMGVGWNLGNTLDANIQSVTDVALNDYWGQQDLKSETCWGQCATKASLMQMLKNAGFGAIRVPVTWYNHIDSEGNVDAAWIILSAVYQGKRLSTICWQ